MRYCSERKSARAAEDTSHAQLTAQVLRTWQKRVAIIREGGGEGSWRVEM